MAHFHPSLQAFDGRIINDRGMLESLQQPLRMLHGHFDCLSLSVLVKHPVLRPRPGVHMLHRNHPIRLWRVDGVLDIVIYHIQVILLVSKVFVQAQILFNVEIRKIRFVIVLHLLQIHPKTFLDLRRRLTIFWFYFVKFFLQKSFGTFLLLLLTKQKSVWLLNFVFYKIW